jgi:hypothetical protein
MYNKKTKLTDMEIDRDTAMFICKVVIGLCLIVKVTLGLIQDSRDKKVDSNPV